MYRDITRFDIFHFILILTSYFDTEHDSTDIVIFVINYMINVCIGCVTPFPFNYMINVCVLDVTLFPMNFTVYKDP